MSTRYTITTHTIVEGKAKEQVRAAVAEGARVILACGGDGTVSSIAAGVVDQPEVTLGILPMGTANAIASCLDLPANPEDACAMIVEGAQTRVIDTAEVNGRTMLLVVSIGVHAAGVTQVEPKRKAQLGPLAYAITEAQHMLSDDLFEVMLDWDGTTTTLKANAVTVANLAHKANLLAQGAPDISPEDGELDLTVVAIEGLSEALATTAHLAATTLLGRSPDRDNVAHGRCRELAIRTKPPQRVMLDGEDAMETPITIRVRPRSLRVFA